MCMLRFNEMIYGGVYIDTYLFVINIEYLLQRLGAMDYSEDVSQ
jgi:hypothetical protein